MFGSRATIEPPFGGPLAVSVRERDAVLQRALGGALQRDIDREADVVAGLRRPRQRQLALRTAQGVDAKLGDAGRPAQVRVERRLDARLADAVAEHVALLPHALQLIGRDLVDVAEHLGQQRLGRVRAQVRLLEVDAR